MTVIVEKTGKKKADRNKMPKGSVDDVELIVCSVDDIESNDYNPNAMEQEQFDVLVAHLQADGKMVQPLLVRPNPNGDGPKYMIVDGEHRWRAAKAAGMSEIMAVVVPYDEDHAKFRTISMNKLRGEYIPLKMAKLIVDLQERYSQDDIRRMTGIKREEFTSLAALLEVPDIDFSSGPSVSMDELKRPIEVNIMLMPDEHGEYEKAMIKAMEIGKPGVVPLIGDEVGQYDKAMKEAFSLASTKLRNVGLATICKIFNGMSQEQRDQIADAVLFTHDD